jgi:holo-[acyl-carrier protein] synthase
MIIGSGVDVVEIARIERVLGERGDRFERRVFTPSEIESCRRAGRPASHYAVRFAAKEAVMKAVGTGWARGVRWVDIETEGVATSTASLSELLALKLHGAVGALAEELASRAGGCARAHLAVSRSRTHAVASVLLEARRP